MLAVTAGIVTLTVTSFAIEWLVNPLLLRLYPGTLPDEAALAKSDWVRALTFAYSSVCVALGGYVCAALAPRRPLRHAQVMGIVQVGMTVLAMLSLTGIASSVQWMIAAALAFPAAVAGGWFYGRRKQAAVP